VRLKAFAIDRFIASSDSSEHIASNATIITSYSVNKTGMRLTSV